MPRIRISLDRARVVGAALFCLCALGLYTLGNDDRFYVQQVVVEGNAILPQAEVERAAGITYWNLFFIDPRSVEAALLRVPEVKYAAVTVELPSQVTIQVLERKPVLIWQTGDKQFWVDGEGLALVERRRVNLPILVDADRRPAGPGEMVAREAVEAAVALLQAWPEGPRVMEWSAARGLAVVAEQGWKVYFGNARQMPEKVAALRVTAQAISRSGLKPAFVDLGNGLPYFQERR